MSFDPWAVERLPDIATITDTGFEDNFFCPLPDSEEYVALLERKLAKLGKTKSSEKKELLDSLEDRKTDVVVRLLTESTQSLPEYFSEEDIPTKWLRSYLNPEQPLTVGELLSLVKEDYLAKSSEVEETTGKHRMTEIWGKKTFCLITGASQGIGREIAKQFSQKLSPGSTMLLMARSLEGLTTTSDIIHEVAPEINVKVVPYDMSTPQQKDFTEVLSEFSPEEYEIYLLVHNAASEGSGRPIRECSDPKEWGSYMTTNLYSMTALTSSFLNVFNYDDDRTVIINITSLAAIQVFPGMGEYAVGKAARETYMKVLSEESPKLRILSYSPGPVDTSMVKRLITNLKNEETKSGFVKMRDEEKLLSPPQTVKKLVDLVAAGLPKYSRVDYYDRP